MTATLEELSQELRWIFFFLILKLEKETTTACLIRKSKYFEQSIYLRLLFLIHVWKNTQFLGILGVLVHFIIQFSSVFLGSISNHPECLEIQLSKSQLDKCIDVQTAVFGTGLTCSKDQEE